MKEIAQLKQLMESIDSVTIAESYAIIPNAAGHANTDLPFDGQTPLYIMRDSDINGMVVSTSPITPAMMSELINKHSHWK